MKYYIYKLHSNYVVNKDLDVSVDCIVKVKIQFHMDNEKNSTK